MQTNLKCFYLQCSRPVPERHPVCVEFLPLNYLTNVLAEIESQGNFNSVLWKTGNCYPLMFTHCYKTSDVQTCRFRLFVDRNHQSTSSLHIFSFRIFCVECSCQTGIQSGGSCYSVFKWGEGLVHYLYSMVAKALPFVQ